MVVFDISIFGRDYLVFCIKFGKVCLTGNIYLIERFYFKLEGVGRNWFNKIIKLSIMEDNYYSIKEREIREIFRWKQLGNGLEVVFVGFKIYLVWCRIWEINKVYLIFLYSEVNIISQGWGAM